jgi:L-ascorbate metabolism protein UlaG (beta-lactamase superfamily)
MIAKTKFEFLGNAAYRITNREGKVILIDPFLDDSDCSPIKVKDLDRVDMILVSHAAWDHMGDTLGNCGKLAKGWARRKILEGTVH